MRDQVFSAGRTGVTRAKTEALVYMLRYSSQLSLCNAPQKHSQMAAIVDFWQHKFATAVSKPVDSVAGARPEIPQHAAEFQLFIPLFADAGATKNGLHDPTLASNFPSLQIQLMQSSVCCNQTSGSLITPSTIHLFQVSSVLALHVLSTCCLSYVLFVSNRVGSKLRSISHTFLTVQQPTGSHHIDPENTFLPHQHS
jgi:hypothetical protein